MHKLDRGKSVLIYAGKKGHTHTHTHATATAARIFSINAHGTFYILYGSQ